MSLQIKGNTPEIRIFFAWLLHENVSVHLDKQLNDGSWKMDTDQELLTEYAENYQKEWDINGQKILAALTSATGLEFYKPVVDVPCAHYFRPQSDPLIMSFYYLPNQFVDALTHELCHILLTDNNILQLKRTDIDLNRRWAKLFGKHEFTTLIHIPVHALSKYIYVDVLKEPSRLERDMQDIKDYPDYVASWEYVNSHDYKEIIKDIKRDYVEIAKGIK